MSPKIVIALPLREGFGPAHFGAIALCVRDFTEHSRFRQQTQIFGGVDVEPFADMPYQPLSFRARWLGSQNRAYAKALLIQLQTLQPELLEIHNRPLLLRYVRAGGWHGKIALHLHNDPQSMRDAKTPTQRQKLLQRCAAVYCVSDYIRQRLLEGVTEGHDKVHVIYNGLARIDNQETKQKTILFVGRFQPEKGALDIARALEAVLPDYPDWRGIFIGAARHQPDAPVNAYERQVMDALRSVESQIEMRGYCSHEETMLATKQAMIAVVPSQWNEAFGRTALEAMACGCATISSTKGGLKEVVGDAGAAYALSQVSPLELERALRDVIENPQHCRNLQRKGQQRALAFSINNVTQTLDDVRATLLGDV